ncbi:MAG TPA: hypothetical protein VFO36_04735 [Nitrospiraceae bacterium]|nr:hypothetical protein [Nitrospiraceae bacterium]
MSKPKRIEWLHSIPALIGVSLGVIYGVGAITIYGQLKGEGISSTGSMALVPLDQILGQGIGRMVRELGQALVIAAFLVVLLGSERLESFGSKDDSPSEPEKKLQWSLLKRGSAWSDFLGPLALTVGTLVFILVSVAMKEALVYVIAFVIGGFVVALMMRFTRKREESRSRRIALTTIASVATIMVSITVVSAFLRPAPLPHARLVVVDGPDIEGGLVTESGGAWYVVQSNESVVAVNGRRVRRSFITYPEREQEQSLVDWILGRPPSKLFGGEREN